MIDWFALLIPLVLVPILLLFVFVGCTLDKTGLPSETNIVFAYGPGLDTIASHIQVDLKVTWPVFQEGESLPSEFTLLRGAGETSPILPGGENIEDGTLGIGLVDDAAVTCVCTITPIPADLPKRLPPEGSAGPKSQVHVDLKPLFILEKVGAAGFSLS
jgi:hypothetical protein